MTTSTLPIRERSASWPPRLVGSSTTDCLLVLRYANKPLLSVESPAAAKGPIARVSAPAGASTLMTRAPKSASSLPQYSAATPLDSSRTRRSLSADNEFFPYRRIPISHYRRSGRPAPRYLPHHAYRIAIPGKRVRARTSRSPHSKRLCLMANKASSVMPKASRKYAATLPCRSSTASSAACR